MRKYVAFRIENFLKFYLKNDYSWETDYNNVKIYLENEIDYYYDKKKKRGTLKTRYSLIEVEDYKITKEDF